MLQVINSPTTSRITLISRLKRPFSQKKALAGKGSDVAGANFSQRQTAAKVYDGISKAPSPPKTDVHVSLQMFASRTFSPTIKDNMAKLWMTYTRMDDAEQDVERAAAELREVGHEVVINRMGSDGMSPTWDHDQHFSPEDSACDGWIVYGSAKSFSGMWRRAYDAVLDQTLKNRGLTFPIVCLSSGPLDPLLLPNGLKNQLHVTLADGDWKERVSAETKELISKEDANDTRFDVKFFPGSLSRNIIELHPRCGS